MMTVQGKRFEEEYPEEATILFKLCANKELRMAVQEMESRFPAEEKIYPHITRWQNPFHTSTSPMKRAVDKIGRNDPCPCGSGKKYKKCCMP